MPVPAHRRSRSRVRSARAHKFLRTSKPSVCPKCLAPIKPHHACGACGFYKGRQVLVTKADVKLKRDTKRKKQEQKEKERMAKLKNK